MHAWLPSATSAQRGPGFGNNRPWSRKITKRRFDPNIQRVRATVNGTPKRLNVCTSCLKAGKVSRCRSLIPVAARALTGARAVAPSCSSQKWAHPAGPS